MKFNIITSTGSDTWIANIPSIIWNNPGNVELFSTGGVYTNPAVFVTDKSSNLPYASGDIPLGSATTDSLIQEKTGFSSTSFTGVNISSILSVSDAFGQQLAVANFFGTGATPAAKVILNSCGGSIPALQTFILGNSSDITIPTSANHPTAPIASAATSITTTSITWNWQTSTGATRYELSADNTTWVDQGNVLTKQKRASSIILCIPDM